MSKAVSKLALAAGLVLAMAFTFGCAGTKSEIKTPASEFRKKCNKDYKDFYCGIGNEVSSDEYTATTFAETKARANMGASIATVVKRVADVATENTHEKNSLSGSVEKLAERSKEDLVDVTVQEMKVLYDKEEKKYTVYVMVTINKKNFLEKLKARIKADQELAALAQTQQIMENISKEIENAENFLDR